ncbi:MULTISPECIES: glycerol-3-phosphate dehydrogenase/oxidase [Streptomyces]|uniref:Glycerol-3-phosphate dehydrogenase n=1 Tax=Streptomyces albus (strain ATCC 21838 / DSM 41398 / FERM P-419 / JCM 4703 / NBRC 107858) TaxID=1081613 RepID=A0A0B5F782_STRA4|nr:glycerol-3-phosphate dehydrogenase/oxidase [Streptomyces sp. SCSIO ZS0520]AJE86726.1 glycerol-3-phosphate dehydrogenase [Streptomyces albus]AOU81030.1 glycerol-3-phosphate dehydrogenase [Streptomyces albus]AYN36733.1 glycerol-3-phosphate dehydrogenase/oxidase [Streptomyces albus]
MTAHPPTAKSGPRSASLNAGRRARSLELLGERPRVDLLVVGGGVTGAGIALDAASRGLSVVLAERHDLAHGTSRWSSKLVHGGLRYLASGEVGVAYESARERGVLMGRTAPHLVRALPMVLPLHEDVSRLQAVLTRVGFLAGDALRLSAKVGAGSLPPSRRIPAALTLALAPALDPAGLRGGQLSYDGQLVDDARLVVALARTAAAHGAHILTRCSAVELTGDTALLRDELTGDTLELRARCVLNATGVWADRLVPGVRLRPSRGTHVVLPAELLGNPRVAVTVPVPGETNRFVFALPQPDGRVYAGLTDEPLDAPVPEVPEAPESDIAFLLGTLSRVLAVELRREDVIGAFAGLRPLLDTGTGRSADLSRRHAVLTSPSGVITAVGGKLTTYRAMAEEAVDAGLARAGLRAGPCRTRTLPLVGAGPIERTAGLPARLVARYGSEAPAVLAEAAGDAALLDPVAAHITGAELRFAVRHEGALDEGDLLDRRTRIGLVPADRERALPAAREALAAAVA